MGSLPGEALRHPSRWQQVNTLLLGAKVSPVMATVMPTNSSPEATEARRLYRWRILAQGLRAGCQVLLSLKNAGSETAVTVPSLSQDVCFSSSEEGVSFRCGVLDVPVSFSAAEKYVQFGCVDLDVPAPKSTGVARHTRVPVNPMPLTGIPPISDGESLRLTPPSFAQEEEHSVRTGLGALCRSPPR